MTKLEIVIKQILKPTLKPCKAKNNKRHTFISYFVKPSVLKFKVYKTNNFSEYLFITEHLLYTSLMLNFKI